MTVDRPLVLATGKLLQYGVDRLRDSFDVLELERSDPGLVSSGDRPRVRAIAAGLSPTPADFIDAFPQLEIIASFGVGYDAVDARHAGQKNVMVTNTPDVLTEEVADTAIALLLNTVRGFSRAERWLRDGHWPVERAYPLSKGTLRERRVGIFGMGRIGQAIARRLEGFAVEIAYHNRREVEGVSYSYYPSLMELAQACDTIINVAPATGQTRNAINAEVLRALGPQGVFINIGRGTTVDEAALIEALRTRQIFAAGLDVFVDEPNVPQALIDLDNAVLLPHLGSASLHTRKAMADLLVDNLESWFREHKPLTPVPETAHVIRNVS